MLVDLAFALSILVPVGVAALVSAMLARREAVGAAPARPGRALLHAGPRASGFGPGGAAVPAPRSEDPNSVRVPLETLMDPPSPVPWWTRAIRLLVLALVVLAAATAVATALYLAGDWAGHWLKAYVTKQQS